MNGNLKDCADIVAVLLVYSVDVKNAKENNSVTEKTIKRWCFLISQIIKPILPPKIKSRRPKPCITRITCITNLKKRGFIGREKSLFPRR